LFAVILLSNDTQGTGGPSDRFPQATDGGERDARAHARRAAPETCEEFIRRYPRVAAHIIAESLGYATPTRAGMIGLDGRHGRENWCEWIYSCYGRNARRALQDAIRRRHQHHSYMAEYRVAKTLVDKLNGGADDSSWFASWF